MKGQRPPASREVTPGLAYSTDTLQEKKVYLELNKKKLKPLSICHMGKLGPSIFCKGLPLIHLLNYIMLFIYI